MRERRRNESAGGPADTSTGARAPGKSARTDGIVVQRRADAGASKAGPSGPVPPPLPVVDAFDFSYARDVQQIADEGVGGAADALPHRDQIQASFGRHDIGGVSAAVGGAAAHASDALGARAYATGDKVGFAAAPDLHTAAHEAAHVVQQRAGVHLAGGVGQEGDAYEQHADAVADAVVQGRSAEPLLDRMAGDKGGSARAVQRIAKKPFPPEFQAQGDYSYQQQMKAGKKHDEAVRAVKQNMFADKADQYEDFKPTAPKVAPVPAVASPAAAGGKTDPAHDAYEACVEAQPMIMTDAGKQEVCEPVAHSGGYEDPSRGMSVDHGHAQEVKKVEAAKADPANITFTFGGQIHVIKRSEWPTFYSTRIKPDFTAAKNQATRIHDSCASLEATNKQYWILSKIVHVFGGVSTHRPSELSTALAAKFQIPEKDIELHAKAVEPDGCIASLRDAVNIVNEADKGLHHYYEAVGRGGEHTITTIKLTAAVAVGVLTGGVGAPAIGIEGAMGLAAAEGAGTEGMTLLLKAVTPGDTLKWSDVQKAFVSVGAKTIGAGAGKALAPKLVPLLAKLPKKHDALTEGAVERYIDQHAEEISKAAVESKDKDEFLERLYTGAVKAAAKVAAGGQLGNAASEGAEAVTK